MVFVLDVSPSAASVEPASGRVVFDGLLFALDRALQAVVQPFTPPGTFTVVRPEIRITVLAQTNPKLRPLRALRVLLQNVSLFSFSTPFLSTFVILFLTFTFLTIVR
jgi:hypothetical protein